MIPKNHPRYESLIMREKIKKAHLEGYLADSGMIAHGRGETFDYLIGEKTTKSAYNAMEVGIAMVLLAENPVISVNGNSTALAIDEIIEFSKVVNAKIEINLFYRTKERIDIIKQLFLDRGYDNILGIGSECRGSGSSEDDFSDNNKEELLYIDNIESPRATASRNGIYSADLVLVALEDGDRAEVLKNSGKKIIAIDLNPLSRTAQIADISIIDNIVRAIPLMTKIAKKLKKKEDSYLNELIANFSNSNALKESLKNIKSNLLGN
ncbi:MAG: phosphopantothenate/pantothenate synthetase [Methanobrevibacter sp.]|jgi:4-phosphopantoate--beta-alanine ligase|nr:phosphopantothenate/pantothenate synthetase [Methanobrevibacter sp.]